MGIGLLQETYLDGKKNLAALERLCNKEIKLNGIGIRLLGIHYMENGQQWRVMKHRHTFFEYHLVVKGHVHTVLDGEEYKVEAGMGYLIPPGMYHSHNQKEGSEHIGFALLFEFTNETMETETFCEFLRASVGNFDLAGERIFRIIIDLLEMKDASVLECQVMVLQLLLNLQGINRGINQVNEPVSTKVHNNNAASQAIRFIEENFMEDIHVEDVASAVFLSYSQLARVFRKYVGVTVNRYLADVRIDKAKNLLKHTEWEIRSIAGETGFNSEYYFCNAFKSHVGMAPSAYRECNRT